MSDEKSKTAEVLKDIYIPLAVGAFFAFILRETGFIFPEVLNPVFIQCFGFGISIGNTVQKFEYPKAAIVPGILGVIIFLGLFGIRGTEILTAGKTYPVQAWLMIATGACVGFAMGKGGL